MPDSVDSCVDSILADPNFKPKAGKTKKESAYAICTAEYKTNKMETIKKRNIWIPLSKNFETNEYQAILSDNSIDRDNERMSKDLLVKWSANPNKFIPMLMDHKNEILNMVGQWTNPTLISNGDSHALAMTPKWFTSNPNAQIVKGMLDDGANIGLSIGAIPKNSREYKSGDVSCKEWTEAELIEASLVPIGSNRNSFITIAKSFGINDEKNTMENEVLRKDLEAEPEAEVEAEPEVEESTEEEAEEEAEAEESVEKSLAAELALLRKEIKSLKEVKTSRKAVLKALNENSQVIAKAVPQENLSVWEQIATLKGIKYGEKYW
jgi:HK97 family phage prohead protease